MADNVVDAIAELIEADGVVNQRVWADDAPPNATKPYITIQDAIATGVAVHGDGRTMMLVRLVQVDLWERLDEEDPTVARRLFELLDGRRLLIDGATVTRMTVDDTPRIPEIDTGIAHRAFTISVRHDRAAV